MDIMAQQNHPIGANTLSIILKVSSATIGRELLFLEANGNIEKISNKGRILTSQGFHTYEFYSREQRLQQSTMKLIQSISEGDIDRLCNILDTRMIIEKETARLATIKMHSDDLSKLKIIIQQQKINIASGGVGDQSDIEFHELIAHLSGNDVLENIIRLIMTNHDVYHRTISYIHYKMMEHPSFSHDAILKEFEKKNSNKAAEAMYQHLSNLKQDVLAVRSKKKV